MRLCVITDEISQDLAHALDVCEDLGVSTVELRAVGGENVVSQNEDSLTEMKSLLDARGIRVGGIASPLFKCHLDGSGEPGGATHFASPAARDEQWQVLERSFDVARLFDAPLVRAFSFWRVERPDEVREEVSEALAEAARRTEAAGLTLGIENEHACNLATGKETGWVLDRVRSPALGVIWDPGNEAAMSSRPFPEGYAHVRDRVVHVHLKDVDERGDWTKMGSGVIDYVGQLRALADDGYAGLLSLETHYETARGGLEGATRESLAEIRVLCKEAGVELEA
ncbi:TIM barrel protein [Rubrobacter tropicus]|uniref:TIM barrel protein n=1 Tax=Rubrobacter tropicus TaxID=2653851 RepID=A0A6G8Q518_9ACTN|nr:sugar phosphate isomerase/epimerase [Rubrobacter tropicus]QIN81550.1 TIM barrel protein [Rubrobacter tropicus]